MLRFLHKAMDTEFSVSFGNVEDASLCEAASAVCFRRIDELEGFLSRFHDTSDVAVIRALKPGEVAKVSVETMEVLVIAANVCAVTQGVFDPTVGAVMDRLRERGITWEALDKDEMVDLFARGGMTRLILDVQNHLVAVKPDQLGRATPVELDFGGIGKGYALDVCAEILRGEQFELSDWLLDAGSSTQVISGGPWSLGVGGKWKTRTHLPTVLKLSEGALSGSGFEIQGQHVVDVKHHGAANYWAQTWCYAKTGAVADALSTAALALNDASLQSACVNLEAGVLVARHNQSGWLNRWRDPLKWFGRSPSVKGEV